MTMTQIRAILLLGPTGSGKTPQGRLLGELPGYRHLDFGAELRRAAGHPKGVGNLSAQDVAFVRALLAEHALLPDDRFDIARKVLAGFLLREGFDSARHVLVLNGLPRTLSQARDLEKTVRVEGVIVFDAGPCAVRARVAQRRRGEGLDDAGREDDSDEAIALKLDIYRRQTAPLISHYREAGVPVLHFRVTTRTDDRSLHRRIVAALSPPAESPARVASPRALRTASGGQPPQSPAAT